jgi:hypothetical protein
MHGKIRVFLMSMSPILILTLAVATPGVAEEHRPTEIAGVENTKMGAYRALAQLAFHEFQKGDKAIAAELARILEKTWDAAEEHGGEVSLGKRNESLFEQIDEAMDAFIKPVIQYAAQTPNPAAVQMAYSEYLKQLQQGE